MYNKGDIVLTPFPFTDLSGSKVRPAVVVASHKKSFDITVVFITSQPKPNGQFVLTIEPNRQNGLKVPSAILCDKIATLDSKVIVGKIGVCSAVDVKRVDVELRRLLGL
jgi:mRNA interferase MazF